MTKQKARQVVARATARSIEADLDTGAEYLLTDENGDALSPADEARIREAALDLAAFLRKRKWAP